MTTRPDSPSAGTLTVNGAKPMSTQELYQYLRQWLTANNIPIAHSVENFNALINTFYGREQDNVFAEDLMARHFEVYTLPDGTIDTQAATDINNYLTGIGAESHAQFDVTPSNDSGPITPPSITPDETLPATGSDQFTPGIMQGGTLTKITRGDGQDPLWAMTYTVGGVSHIYTFDSLETMQATLGQDAVTSGTYGYKEYTDQQIRDDDSLWILGDAVAFAGQSGQTYGTYWDDIMYEAGLEAGIRNPGKIGEYLSQPDIQRIIAMGEAGGWSPARIQAEVRNTDYYLNVLYPGIENILNSGVAGDNPEAYYYRYMDSVESSLSALGYAKDSDGSYRSRIGEMLNAGITAEEFNTFTPTFVRAEQSQEYASVLSQWTQRDLGIGLDFDNWFDVLAGSSSPELNQVVEKATIQFQANLAQTSLSSDQISRLAELTQLSEQQMTLAFSQAEEALLSVGQADLERYGLSEQALVNAAFGVDTGDESATDIRRRARKAAAELSIQDDTKAGFFVGFDRFGRPNRQGLGASAPEAG